MTVVVLDVSDLLFPDEEFLLSSFQVLVELPVLHRGDTLRGLALQ